jgi:hypothetical protein
MVNALGFSIAQRVHTGVATINPQENTMTTNNTTPATQNDAWGFYGTMNEHADAAWAIAMSAVAEATGQSLETVRIFMDSRHGRHFADSVLNQMHHGANLDAAINAATQEWMGWTIGRITSKEYGIPRGLPYLTGFVIHCEIVEEACAE